MKYLKGLILLFKHNLTVKIICLAILIMPESPKKRDIIDRLLKD